MVDVLVNNAGFGALGAFAELPLKRQLEMLQVNITALTELTGLFLSGMIQRRRGGILNVVQSQVLSQVPAWQFIMRQRLMCFHLRRRLPRSSQAQTWPLRHCVRGRLRPISVDVANFQKERRLKKIPKMSAETVARCGHQVFS